MSRKKWTPEDYERLREGWGKHRGGISILASSMGRSVNSIKIKAIHLHLGPWLDAGEYVTLNGLLKAIFGNGYCSHQYTYCRLLRLKFPVKKRRNDTAQFLMVRIEDFWKWAEQHQHDLDFSRFEECALGAEPEWAKQKRLRDRENKLLVLPKKSRWSLHEDALLQTMCERGTTWSELDAAFQRSSDAIRRRIYDLGCSPPARLRPLRWSQEEMDMAAKLDNEGYSIDYIAKRLGKTSQSIRGKLEWLKKRERKRGRD